MPITSNKHQIAFVANTLDKVNEVFRHPLFASVVEQMEKVVVGAKQFFEDIQNALACSVSWFTTNSGNSSMPPSADANASAIREKKKEEAQKLKPLKEKRKPGGQPGHKGTTLKITDKPDEVKPIYPKNLPKGGDYVFEVVTSFQDVDIEIKRTVIQYDYYKAIDRKTGKVYEPEILGQHLSPNAKEIRPDFPVVTPESSSEASLEASLEASTVGEAKTAGEGNPQEQAETCLKRVRKPRTKEQRDKRRRMRRRKALGYGPSIKAMAVHLNVDNFVPSLRTTMFCAGLGCNVSEGSIYNWITEASLRLQELGYPAFLCRGLMSAKTLHLDETYMRFDKKRTYIHVWTDERWTLYHFSLNRGLRAHEEVGIYDLDTEILTPFLECCDGDMVHDAWGCYFKYKKNEHALCHAHVERELNKFAEMKVWNWAKNFITFFKDLYRAVEAAGGAVPEEEFKKRWLRRYKRLLTSGFNEMSDGEEARKEVPKQVFQKASALRTRLEERWWEYLVWAIKPNVPYTNNLAERRVRMMKVRDKVSNCFRDLEFARDWCLVRSYIQTARNLGGDGREALECLFRGQLPECIMNAVADLPPLPDNCQVLYAG